jgi:hypothetical protein
MRAPLCARDIIVSNAGRRGQGTGAHPTSTVAHWNGAVLDVVATLSSGCNTQNPAKGPDGSASRAHEASQPS